MLILRVHPSPSIDVDVPIDPVLSSSEDQALRYVSLSIAAERHLISPGVSCLDHQVCRRLAFVRFLFLTGRVRDDDSDRS